MTRYASLILAACAALALFACQGPADNTQLTVDPERCIGCGRCEEVCPYGAVEVIDGNAVIDPALCHFCFQCVEVCPEGAIY
jgi:formate hydrogenlyase subunit 6/NADH:ubiquinone oxidoreductase subunit I